MTPDEAAALQRKYITRRKRWGRSIGRPYADDDRTPEPGVIDDLAEEEG